MNWRSHLKLHSSPFAAEASVRSRFVPEFIEQPHVLDSDDGLIGEGFEEPDLHRGERTNLGAARDQSSKSFPVLKGEQPKRCG